MPAALRTTRTHDLPALPERIAALERRLQSLASDGPMTPHRAASVTALEAIVGHYRDSQPAPGSRLQAAG